MKENVYNASKLAFHRQKLESLAAGEVTPPIYVRIKPTNVCDHHCSFCSYNPDNNCPVSETINYRDEIPREKLLETLDEFREMRESSGGIGVLAITYSGGGEPLVYPHIVEAMKKTLDCGIELSIITNGQKLRGERAEVLAQAEWVRVSSGESDSRTFHEVRKVPEKWFKVLADNLKGFAQLKKPSCEFGINFVVHEGNVNQVYASAGYFQGLGLNHIKFTPVYNDHFLEYHREFRKIAEEQIERARQDFEKTGFRVYDTYKNDFEMTGLGVRKYPVCHTMQINPIIGADCMVYFCHDKSYNLKGALGSIKHQTFRQLWFSPESAEKFRTFDPRANCQHHCTADARNLGTIEMLANLANLEKYQPSSDKHKNFV